jgi:hypothetical protein
MLELILIPQLQQDNEVEDVLFQQDGSSPQGHVFP